MQKNSVNDENIPMYKNKNIGKTVRITKQINNDVYFIIDGIEEILDVSVFNEHYEVVEPLERWGYLHEKTNTENNK